LAGILLCLDLALPGFGLATELNSLKLVADWKTTQKRALLRQIAKTLLSAP
jgi:hypothetical protein